MVSADKDTSAQIATTVAVANPALNPGPALITSVPLVLPVTPTTSAAPLGHPQSSMSA